MTTSGPRQLLKRLAGEIGITGPHNPHAFRHAFARRMLANGMDISDLSRLMGHSSIQVTAKHYLCWTAAELGQKHAQFNSLDEIKITTRDL
jgi:site-specific recombinase XerD